MSSIDWAKVRDSVRLDKEQKIITVYDPKPIPTRQFDWTAVFDGYEPGCPIGYGRTEQEAIADLEAEI